MPSSMKNVSRSAVGYLLPVLVYLVSAPLVWQGLGFWDSVHYVSAALDLLEFGPALGDRHWDLRYPLVLPVAASLAIFGPSELAASVPSFIYGLGLVLATTAFGMRHLGRAAGVIFGMLIATSVSLVLLPLAVEIRGPEIFFVALSLWLFVSGTGHRLSAPLLIGSGVAAAFAFLCREVSAYVPPTIAVAALLFTPRDQWLRAILFPAIGFLAVMACEFAFYTVASGDPLFRYRLSLNHNEISGGSAKELASGLRERGLVETLVTPVKRYAAAQTTLPVAAVGGLAAVSLIFMRGRLSPSTRRTLGVFVTAAMLSYLLAALVLNLQSPRYFPVLDYLACMMIAVAVANFGLSGWRKLALLPVVGVLVSGPIAADATRGFLFQGARPAVQAAKDEEELITVSYWVHDRAMALLRLEGRTVEDASAEFIRENDATPEGLYYGYGGDFPCRRDADTCDFVVVKDLGKLKLSWGQRARVSLCENVPSVSGVFCDWRIPTAALYRHSDALQ